MTYAAPGLSRHEYESFGGWNASLLKLALSKTPAHAYREYLDPDRVRSPETPAMRLGTLVHEALLEPLAFESHLVTDKGATTKSYALELAQAEAVGKRLVQEKERDQAAGIALSVRSHPVIGRRFPAEGHPLNELSLCWTDDGVKCRARLDAVRWIGGTIWIADLKTTADANPEEFGKSALNFNYLLQAAFYADGVRACAESIGSLLDLPEGVAEDAPIAFEFVAVEKSRPYPVARYAVTDDQIELGRKMYRRAISIVESARQVDHWLGYDNAAIPLELPPWADRVASRLAGD